MDYRGPLTDTWLHKEVTCVLEKVRWVHHGVSGVLEEV